MTHMTVIRKSICLVRVLAAVVISPLLAIEASAQDSKDAWPSRLGFGLHRKPALSLYYGFAQSSLKGLNQSLANPRLIEIKLGGTSEDVENDESSVVSYRYSYFSLANISNELGPKAPADEVTSDLWRLGVASEKGYGYSLTDSGAYRSVLLCHSGGVHWSRLSVRSAATFPQDSALLDLYDGAFRFGTKMEGGVKLRLMPLVIVDIGFERAIVFRRHLFWKWVGSVALEGAANWGLDRFINGVLESSPTAVPIVSFVLKNTLSYGVYQLRRDMMYYPFNSEAPLLFDTFKVGATLVF